MKGDLDVIKQELQNRIGEVCARLLPHGKDEGGHWVSFNPVENDYKPGRLPALKVRLRGGVVGAWKDWRTGQAGDVIGLVAYIEGTDTSGALVWARDFLGIRNMTRADRENMRKVAAQQKADRERQDEKRRRDKLAAADRLFFANTSPIGTMTPAEIHARNYFAGRKVALDLVENLNPETFRFAAATEWWKGAKWENQGARKFKAAPGPSFPAIHSAMRIWNGHVTCCHVTFLDPLKFRKAPVEPAKLMFGEALGAVIEISTGPSEVPFWQAAEAGPLIIAEGIETALSFAVSVPEARIWAGGSLAGVGAAPVNLPCVEWVLFARDNNDGNPQAQKQFDRALGQLETSGKRIVVEASHVGDDFNDLAQGEE